MKLSPVALAAILSAVVESTVNSFNKTVAPTTLITSTIAAPTAGLKLSSKTVPVVKGLADSYVYNGCWTEGTGGLALTGGSFVPSGGMTVEKCINHCKIGGFGVAGIEFGQVCYCGAELTNGAKLVDALQCGLPCSGDRSEVCGGEGRLTTYKSG